MEHDGFIAQSWIPGNLNPDVYYLSRASFDADITPRLKTINNLNFLWFDETEVYQLQPALRCELDVGRFYVAV